jgi:TolB protein
MNPDGSGLTQLTNATGGSNPAWSPDGRRIAFEPALPLNVADIAVMNADGSDLHTIVKYIGREPSWSPDGTRIAFDSDQGDHPAGDGIYTMSSADGGSLARVTANPYGWFDIQPAWSPDGRWIAFSRIRSVTPDGPAEGRARHRAITALYVVRPDGTGLRRLTPWGIDVVSPDWSPDGRWIAFSSMEEAPEPAQIWLVQPDGSARHAITSVTGGGFVGFGEPVFSPDGSLIMAEGRVDPTGSRQLWLMNADGSGLHVLPIAGPADSFPDWGTAPLQ